MSDSPGTILRQFIRFASVGVIGTLSHYTTLVILVEAVTLGPVPASAIGFVVGAFVNYYLNRVYTFQSSIPHINGLPKFLAVAVAGAILNVSIMTLAITYFSIHYLVVQVIATGVVLAWNFLGNRLWTFEDASKETS